MPGAVVVITLSALAPGAMSAGKASADSPLTCVAPADAAGIDAILRRAGSPLAGDGATFVSEGVAAGIDPRLLIAIASHETRLETYPPARAIKNPFGLGPGMEFASETAAIASASRILGAYYVEEGRIRISTIGPKWAPIGAANDPKGLNKNWVGGVSAAYAALGGDPTRPVLLGSQPGVSACAAQKAAARFGGPIPAEARSLPERVTPWAAALSMLLVVGYLARSRTLEQPDATDQVAAAEGVSDAWLMAQAETAATCADPVLELEDAVGDETSELAVVVGIEAGAATDDEPEIVAEAMPAPAHPAPVPSPELIAVVEAVVQSVVGAMVDADADGGAPEAVAEVAETPAIESVAPAEAEAEVVVETSMTPPAGETAPQDDPIAGKQAEIVADLVPVLLNGLLPLERICDHSGVTPRMLALMRLLADTPLSVSEQAVRLGVPRAVVADLSARLEAMGLAEREALGTGRRRIRIALTEAGYTLCADTAAEPAPGDVAAALSRLSDAERAGLIAGLRALARA